MRTVLAVALLLAVPFAGQAQQLPTFISSVSGDTTAPARAAAFGHPGDYRLEGLIAGAVLVGGAFTAITIAVCQTSDSCETGDALLVSLGTIALGGFAGALIGGAIPKAPPASPSQASRLQRASNARFELAGPRVAFLSLAWQIPGKSR
jgi:hypothetical protein